MPIGVHSPRSRKTSIRTQIYSPQGISSRCHVSPKGISNFVADEDFGFACNGLKISGHSSDKVCSVIFIPHRIEEGAKLPFLDPTDIANQYFAFLSKGMPQRMAESKRKETVKVNVPVTPGRFFRVHQGAFERGMQ